MADSEETFRDLIEKARIERDEDTSPPCDVTRPRPRSNTPPSTGALPTLQDTRDEFRRPGVQLKEMRRLKQGRFRIDDDSQLDLHGLMYDEAHHTLFEFIDNCISNGIRFACVVCGKGIHSRMGKPVLRSAVRNWLEQYSKVLAYHTAKLKDGGSGAVYILLKTGQSQQR